MDVGVAVAMLLDGALDVAVGVGVAVAVGVAVGVRDSEEPTISHTTRFRLSEIERCVESGMASSR